MNSANSFNKGFSLVQLSIVLVIISFLIVGITAGQSLVKSSKLQSILSQASQVNSAINAFKLQYDSLPGNMSNASTTWTTGCASAGGSGASNTNQCNGSGNKKIIIAAGNTGEMYMAWLHLSLADLFPGTFVPGTVLTGTIGTKIPAAKYTGAGMTIGYDDATISVEMLSTTATLSKNILLFGATRAGNIANTGFLTTAQASSLDKKADDGNAVAGLIYAGESAAADRGTGTCASAAGAYTMTSTSTTSCTIAFSILQ